MKSLKNYASVKSMLVSARELRNTETALCVPFLRIAYGQKCFCFRGANLWSGLDANWKLTKKFKRFKSCLENSEHDGALFDS